MLQMLQMMLLMLQMYVTNSTLQFGLQLSTYICLSLSLSLSLSEVSYKRDNCFERNEHDRCYNHNDYFNKRFLKLSYFTFVVGMLENRLPLIDFETLFDHWQEGTYVIVKFGERQSSAAGNFLLEKKWNALPTDFEWNWNHFHINSSCKNLIHLGLKVTTK